MVRLSQCFFTLLSLYTIPQPEFLAELRELLAELHLSLTHMQACPRIIPQQEFLIEKWEMLVESLHHYFHHFKCYFFSIFTILANVLTPPIVHHYVQVC
jgi:hypothetical protein